MLAVGEKYRYTAACESCSSIDIPVSSPSDCLKGLAIAEKPLGRGDVGIAYEIIPGGQVAAIGRAYKADGKYVLKEITFPVEPGARRDKAIKEYQDEVCIGKSLGNAGIAPAIYSCWVCNNKGYYVMDRMKDTWQNRYGPKYSDGHLEYERTPTILHEAQLIYCLATMISLGVVHQDCHPGNIGFTFDDKVVIFDFGFAVIAQKTINYPEIMLMSQLYIVLELWDKEYMYNSYLYALLYKIRQNSITLDQILMDNEIAMRGGKPAERAITAIVRGWEAEARRKELEKAAAAAPEAAAKKPTKKRRV
jgi:serine/threonine protein kinase